MTTSSNDSKVPESTGPPLSPITEIARLRLHDPKAIQNDEFRTKLHHARLAMEKFTGRTFYIMQEVQFLHHDDNFIYIVGEWNSLDQHYKEWIPSQENQDILGSLQNDITVQWIFHIDMPHAELPLPKTEEERLKAIRGQVIYSLERYVIKEGKRFHFDHAFKRLGRIYKEYITQVNGGTLGAGWILEKTQDMDSFCIMSTWASVAEHTKWRDEDESLEYASIEDHVMENMIQTDHVMLLDI
ncbi:hypothetical protein P280DRAFT_510070 [Massarina eburnea CBS 473.64]|uniref:ABM domain-containing protein n=1 Tax=Massarina eburnea CBS 473.64 TaxID=1395130 RepID=A0A6A6RPF1_9PLEO|nr:hypothetical protein P280DRAFT_510070 [Massarina eburnea CBS 473.64]